jgi:hypothetical protein
VQLLTEVPDQALLSLGLLVRVCKGPLSGQHGCKFTTKQADTVVFGLGEDFFDTEVLIEERLQGGLLIFSGYNR